MDLALGFPIPIVEDSKDAEDHRERTDFDIEQALLDFVDEPRVRHNVCPDADIDDPEEIRRMHEKRHEIKRGEGVLFKGQVFLNGVAFKEAVLDHALKTGRNIRQMKYDPVKAGFICVPSGDKQTKKRFTLPYVLQQTHNGSTSDTDLDSTLISWPRYHHHTNTA